MINNGKYIIVTDPALADMKGTVPQALQGEIDELYLGSQKGKGSVKEKLQKLIVRHPDLPFLRNYLIAWYSANGMAKEATELNEELIALFPDYIFAITFRVRELASTGKADEAWALLREKKDIGEFYPDRKAFHISEFKAYISATVICLAYTERYDEAEEQIALLEKADTTTETTSQLHQLVMQCQLESSRAGMDPLNSIAIHARERETCTLPQRDVAMVPLSPELAFLYGAQWKMDAGRLRNAITNNKEQLVAELKHIITTAIEGYTYSKDNEKWSPAVLHALLIFPYVDDEAAFPAMLEFIRQPGECVRYWTSDWGEEIEAAHFKKFSRSKLDQMYEVLTESPGSNYGKVTLACLAPHFTYYEPDTRPVIIGFLRSVIEFFEANRDNAELFDTDVMAYLIGAALDLKAVELMDLIKEVYEKEHVSIIIAGDLDDVNMMMSSEIKTLRVTAYDNVYAHLDHLNPDQQDKPASIPANVWRPGSTQGSVKAKQASTNIFLNASKNSPCPCGSGKKYKRCHGM